MGTQQPRAALKPAVIVNGARAAADIEAELRAAGLEPDIRVVAGDIAEAARDAAKRGCHMIVAGGGDGTVSAVAGAIAGTGCILGVLPLGTFNNFARDLGIPLDIAGAARVLAAGRTAEIDAAEVNGRVFINNSGIGLYPWVVERRTFHERRGLRRPLAFLWAALPILRRYRFMRVALEADGREFQRRTPFVFIGNNVYRLEGLRAARREKLDGGTLQLVAAHSPGRLGLVRLAFCALFGRLREVRDFDLVEAAEIRISTRRRRRVRVSLDGEVVRIETPLRYRVLPRALRVVVP